MQGHPVYIDPTAVARVRWLGVRRTAARGGHQAPPESRRRRAARAPSAGARGGYGGPRVPGLARREHPVQRHGEVRPTVRDGNARRLSGTQAIPGARPGECLAREHGLQRRHTPTAVRRRHLTVLRNDPLTRLVAPGPAGSPCMSIGRGAMKRRLFLEDVSELAPARLARPRLRARRVDDPERAVDALDDEQAAGRARIRVDLDADHLAQHLPVLHRHRRRRGRDTLLHRHTCGSRIHRLRWGSGVPPASAEDQETRDGRTAAGVTVEPARVPTTRRRGVGALRARRQAWLAEARNSTRRKGRPRWRGPARPGTTGRGRLRRRRRPATPFPCQARHGRRTGSEAARQPSPPARSRRPGANPSEPPSAPRGGLPPPALVTRREPRAPASARAGGPSSPASVTRRGPWALASARAGGPSPPASVTQRGPRAPASARAGGPPPRRR